MRYTPIEMIKEGMVLARPVYGTRFDILLGEGVTLSNFHIQRINQLGYAGVYILDDLSQGVEVRDILPGEIRMSTVRTAKDMYLSAEQRTGRKSTARTSREKLEKMTMPVVDSIIENPRRLVELIDLKPEDDYLYYHAANTVILSVLIGVEMGLSGVALYELCLSAFLHDVGNLFIPKTILEKPGKLTPEEYDVIKSHTQLGFDYLYENYEISIEGCMGAQQHHENFDGSGYPSGLRGNKISIYGRIIAITDVYDALTSRRPFRKMMYPPAAMEYLNEKAGTMFDPEILDVFQLVVPLYPSGLCVELNSGVRGIVVKNYVGAPNRPKVRLLNSKSETPLYVDLHEDVEFSDTYVTQIIEI